MMENEFLRKCSSLIDIYNVIYYCVIYYKMTFCWSLIIHQNLLSKNIMNFKNYQRNLQKASLAIKVHFSIKPAISCLTHLSHVYSFQ